MKPFIRCLSFAYLLVIAATTVNAQNKPEYQPSEPAPPSPAAAGQAKVSEAQLNSYIDASDKVGAIQQELQSSMQNAEDSAEAQEMQEKAQQKMVDAVESAGLTVQDYNKIAMLIQNDPNVREKLKNLVE